MNIYQGVHRRQVGGGLWSTISRGIRPLILNLIKTLKPHAVSAAKRMAHSAAKIGTEMSVDALAGKFTKDKLKNSVKREATELSQDALTTLKRKLDNVQKGSGNKRRRIHTPRNSKMKRRVTKRCTAKRSRRTYKKATRTKQRSKVNKRNKSRGIRKRKTKRQSVNRRALKDIFNS